MRDEKRLDNFYAEIARIHKKYFPDWRFGQLICNIQRTRGNDLFYFEEDDFLDLLKEYVGEDN